MKEQIAELLVSVLAVLGGVFLVAGVSTLFGLGAMYLALGGVLIVFSFLLARGLDK